MCWFLFILFCHATRDVCFAPNCMCPPAYINTVTIHTQRLQQQYKQTKKKQYGLEEEQRNRLLRTYIRNAFSFHLNEIFSAVRNEYTDWDKPIQHPINIR